MTRRRFILAACASLATAFCAGSDFRASAAEATSFAAGRSEREVRLLADARDGRLDEHSLLAAALIACGSEDPELSRECEDRLQSLVGEFRSSPAFQKPPAELAAAMHQFLHSRVLTGDYDVNANSVCELLRRGRFNCITASTLLLALAESCGVEAAAWEAPAHVLVVIDPYGSATLVEMTRRQWRSDSLDRMEIFETRRANPFGGTGENGETSDSAAGGSVGAAVTGSAASAAGNRPARRPAGRLIRPTQLLATYYHNRGVERLSARDYSAAVALNETALELDGECSAARQNLLAAWNNWALALADAGDFGAALEKIDRGLAISPNYEPLRENRVFIENRRVARQRPRRSARRVGPVASMFL